MIFQPYTEQAGAELGQAQVKLDAIIEVVKVVNLSSTTILVGGWVVGQINKINTKLNTNEVVVEVEVRVELLNEVEVGVSLLFRVGGWMGG